MKDLAEGHALMGWVLGAVAVPVTVLMAEGYFTPVDFLIGVTLLLILQAGASHASVDARFRWAYSTLAATCWILVTGIFLDALLRYFIRIDKKVEMFGDVIQASEREMLMFLTWVVVSLIYRFGVTRSWSSSRGAESITSPCTGRLTSPSAGEGSSVRPKSLTKMDGTLL